ncbi:hypothetical protein NPIL_185131 [Nephila pilipes]|uniref:Uncharacterized protein n=1 Tax=Nephila pilipes TaxID=299642 RepID=A0A8X6U9U3_NEPPI|nr:hypothetical protein NPIL_185131 [Nephila pilipes]
MKRKEPYQNSLLLMQKLSTAADPIFPIPYPPQILKSLFRRIRIHQTLENKSRYIFFPYLNVPFNRWAASFPNALGAKRGYLIKFRFPGRLKGNCIPFPPS